MTEHRNRLGNEQSPYLLQHATNPVDWYPWGEEAFRRAREKDLPLFISIGYAACHWCHVMERESFEDAGVAKLLNDAFVCVKVDREERPDVDRVYMDVAMMMTGRGGWPLTIIASPDGTPFFAATYIPREPRFGRPGLTEIIPKIVELYRQSPGEIVRVTEQVRASLGSPTTPPPDEPCVSLLAAGRDALRSQFDARNGGFGSAPKFPSPHQLMFLLRWWRRAGDPASLSMVTRTLDAMAGGGIRDHLDGGFHRYSTDERWHLPHFEKMLYDQALMAFAASETYQATREERFAGLAQDTLDYALRRLRAPEGGFYCSEDADSEGGEGRFYLWSVREIREKLGDDAGLLIDAHGLTERGNAIDEATGEATGANVLGAGTTLDALASSRGETVEETAERLAGLRARLLEVRKSRPRPALDDKVLTDWNGLMISALAFSARALDEPRFCDAASRAVDFVLDTMLVDGRLLHRYREGHAGVCGNLDDYAFLVWGLLELHATTQDTSRLEQALALTATMLEHFSDAAGGFHFTPDDGEKLVARPKEIFDGAVPAGNSVAMVNLVRLARLTGRTELEDVAYRAAGAVSGSAKMMPSGHTFALSAIDLLVGPTSEVVVAGRRDTGDTRAFLDALATAYRPRTSVLVADGATARLAPWTRGMTADGGSSRAYVCRDGTCALPASTPSELLGQLDRKSGLTEDE